jgi:hypothetical protein
VRMGTDGDRRAWGPASRVRASVGQEGANAASGAG